MKSLFSILKTQFYKAMKPNKMCSCGLLPDEKCMRQYPFQECIGDREGKSEPALRDGGAPLVDYGEESPWDFLKMLAWFFKEEFVNGLWKLFVFALLAWVVITSGIQRFKCPHLTETELFLLLPKTVICDFKEC